jgi:hypothetical protein
LVGRDTVAKARVYTIGALNNEEADRFLTEHMRDPTDPENADVLPSASDRKWALQMLGTHISELRVLCQDWQALNEGRNLGLSGHALGGKADAATISHMNRWRHFPISFSDDKPTKEKTEKEKEKERKAAQVRNTAALKSLVERYVGASEMEWKRVFSDIEFSSPVQKLETLTMLDHMVKTSKQPRTNTAKKGNREYVRTRGLIPVLERLLEEEMVTYTNVVDIDFCNSLMREGYLRYRKNSRAFNWFWMW